MRWAGERLFSQMIAVQLLPPGDPGSKPAKKKINSISLLNANRPLTVTGQGPERSGFYGLGRAWS
jgi:hypothetical protein